MFTFDEILNMTPEEFSENWKNNKIQDASLKLLGRRELTEADKQHLDTHK